MKKGKTYIMDAEKIAAEYGVGIATVEELKKNSMPVIRADKRKHKPEKKNKK